jgi:hypothetical protein
MFTVDEPVYKARMEQYVSNGQTKELPHREICKRMQITSANVRLVCNTVLLIPTGGVTSVGVLLAIWRRRKAQKKYNIIVATMKQHDIKMPKRRKLDRALPIAVTIGVYMATLGMVWGLDHIISEAAMNMMPVNYIPIDNVANVSGTEASQQAYIQAMDASMNIMQNTTEVSQQAYIQAMDASMSFMQNTTVLANEGLSNAGLAV